MKSSPCRQASGFHILLIEDNPVDANKVKELLAESTGFDFSLREVASMAVAEGYLAVEPFDVILLDRRMADGVAVECLDRAEATTGVMPVLVVTVDCKPEVYEELMNSGLRHPWVKERMRGSDLIRAIKTLAATRN